LAHEYFYKIKHLPRTMIKLFNKDEYKNRGRLFGWGSGGDADWRVLFIVFLILMLASVSYSSSSFIRVLSGSFGSDISSSTEMPINKNLIKRTADAYRLKQANFEAVQSVIESTPDPSI
jgi:hypothetical protein